MARQSEWEVRDNQDGESVSGGVVMTAAEVVARKSLVELRLSRSVNQREFSVSRARAAVPDRVFVRARCAYDSSRRSSQ